MNWVRKTLWFLAGWYSFRYFNTKTIKTSHEMQLSSSDHYRKYFSLACHWLNLNHSNISIADFFFRRNIQSIAVYGSGSLGNQLLLALQGHPVKVAYIIDQQLTPSPFADDSTPVIHPDEISSQETVDMIVVTPIYQYAEIHQFLSNQSQAQIVSLEDVVYEF